MEGALLLKASSGVQGKCIPESESTGQQGMAPVISAELEERKRI